MDFARRQLEKYGWTKGAGLGKTGSGITKALKPKVKLNKGGIGHDFAKEHTDFWWEKNFNEAAGNIKVDISEGKVSFGSSGENSKKNKKKHVYLGFVQRGTNMTPLTEEITEEIDEHIAHPKLSDDELFKACGGRTSHKAARHGLKLSGKLARIQQQEEAALLATTSIIVKKLKRKEYIDDDIDAKKVKK